MAPSSGRALASHICSQRMPNRLAIWRRSDAEGFAAGGCLTRREGEARVRGASARHRHRHVLVAADHIQLWQRRAREKSRCVDEYDTHAQPTALFLSTRCQPSQSSILTSRGLRGGTLTHLRTPAARGGDMHPKGRTSYVRSAPSVRVGARSQPRCLRAALACKAAAALARAGRRAVAAPAVAGDVDQR